MTAFDLSIPVVYANYPDGGERAYRALCKILTGKQKDVDWVAFDESSWKLLEQMADIEGVAALAYWSSKVSGWPPEMPESLQSNLKLAYYRTAANNQILIRELERILNALSGAGIPVIVLKGAALATQLYPDPALRPMRDLDLLVSQKDLDKAAEKIRQLDYEEVPVQSKALNRRIGTQVVFHSREIMGLEVELHWSLIAGEADWRRPDIGWFWDRSEYFTPGKEHILETDPTKFLTLTPTAHLLYLIAHCMLQHAGKQSQLVWLYDIHMLISSWSERLDWLDLVEGGRNFHWASALLPALERCHACFGTPIPPLILSEMLNDRDNRADRMIQSLSTSPQLEKGDHWSRWTALDWKARLWYARVMVFPNKEFMGERYRSKPDIFWPLAYPLRWVELMKTGLAAFWEQMRQKSKKIR